MDESSSKTHGDSTSVSVKVDASRRQEKEVQQREAKIKEEHMESDISDQLPLSKEQDSTTEKDPTAEETPRITLGELTLRVAEQLTTTDCQNIATLAEFKPAEREQMTNGVTLMNALESKNIYDKSNLQTLLRLFKDCKLYKVAGIIEQYKTVTFMDDKKTRFIKELRTKYKNLCGQILPVPFLREKYEIDKLFVERGIKFLEDKQGDTEVEEKWKEIKNHKMIFTDPRIKSSRRIIDGEPGYGKTILALQITHDWCLEIAPMKDFEILILLRLRQFRNVSNVYLAITKFLLPRDSTLTEADIKNILDSSSVVVLLDGYDEYPERWNKETDIEYIIKGDMFQKHEVILFTRTSCLPHDPSPDTTRIRLTGFDDTVRYTYILNVVTRGDPVKAQELDHLLKNNPAAADLCKVPMFCVMISHMAKRETFEGLKTVTKLFNSVIACFYSHEQRRAAPTDIKQRKGEQDHTKLDRIAFEALRGDSQKITWDKKELLSKIGDDLYNEYISKGIFREEEVFDEDDFDYKTETRFFHKLFAEWYAAYYLAKEITQPKAQSEPGHNTQGEAIGISHHPSNAWEKVDLLRGLNPRDLNYMYRFACGSDSDAAMDIIKYLSKNGAFDDYTLMCITEWMANWSGSLDAIEDIVTLLCSRRLFIRDADSILVQKSSLEFIEFASKRKIPLKDVVLFNCLGLGEDGSLCVKPSNLSLPVMDTLSKLRIYRYAGEITEEETNSIFQYLEKCSGSPYLRFSSRLMPQHIKVTESMSALRERKVKVAWWSTASRNFYVLNFESGQWDLDPL